MRALTVLLVLAACAACTAAPTPPPSDAAPTTAPGAISLPPRPRDIPIDDIDPCSLLPQDTLDRLGLVGETRNRTSSTSLLGPARECTILTFNLDATDYALAVALAPSMDIGRFTGGELLTDVSPLTVEGFPAVLAQAQNFDDVCSVVLDVAPGQIISIDFSDGGGDQPPVPREILCDGAQRTAVEVMRNLFSTT